MFSENFKKYRKKKQFSQESLAMQLFVTRQTVSKWEKGLSMPDVQMLLKISDVLEVSVNELLKDDHTKKKECIRMNYDVIIVGAGPGGIFAAYELMQHKPKLKVAVFEAGHALDKRKCPIDGEKVKNCISCKS